MSTYGNQTPPYDAAYRLRHPIFAGALLHLPLNEPDLSTPFIDLRAPLTPPAVISNPSLVSGGGFLFTNPAGGLGITRTAPSWVDWTVAFTVSGLVHVGTDFASYLPIFTLMNDAGDFPNSQYTADPGPSIISVSGRGDGSYGISINEDQITTGMTSDSFTIVINHQSSDGYVHHYAINGVEGQVQRQRVANSGQPWKSFRIGANGLNNSLSQNNQAVIRNVAFWGRPLSQAERVSWSLNPSQYFVKDISGVGGRRGLSRARGL